MLYALHGMCLHTHESLDATHICRLFLHTQEGANLSVGGSELDIDRGSVRAGDAIGSQMWAMNVAGKHDQVIELARSNGFRFYNL
jgi:hypothetical protein